MNDPRVVGYIKAVCFLIGLILFVGMCDWIIEHWIISGMAVFAATGAYYYWKSKQPPVIEQNDEADEQ